MIGKNTEDNFDINNYEEFYESHHFEPIPEKFCTTVNEVIPRFGWGFDLVEELKPARLLDIGCLDGSFALSVASQLNVSVVGVDLTKDGIQLARERAEKLNIPARFYQGFAEDVLRKLAESGQQFDVITMFEIIEHVEDVPLLLELIDKVLAPGGSVLVSTPDFESPLYGADDERNKCHIRLYTTAKEDYERPNKYGNVRKATSIWKEIGEDRIQSVATHNELLNVHYK